VKRRAFVLFDGATGDEQRHEFAFGDLHGGKRVYWVRVAVGVELGIELYRQVEPVAHEGDVAYDGLARDIEVVDELSGIDRCGAPQFLVDAEHAFERWAGEFWGEHGPKIGLRNLFQIFLGWDSKCPTLAGIFAT